MATFTSKAPATFIRCSCCPTPVAEFKDGAIVIVVKHHGEQHETRIRLDELARMK